MVMNIPLADPTRELKKIKNFESNFNKKLHQGIYVGGNDVNNFENNFKNNLETWQQCCFEIQILNPFLKFLTLNNQKIMSQKY